jgi:putative transposase
MISQVSQPRLKGFRFPRSIISYAIWAYHRFGLSLRDVEDLLAERGVIVSYESIRVWCQRFGTQIVAKIRRDRPIPADKWHLDEVVTSIRRRKHWLWRAVDANGDVLEILMQSRRNAHAAKRFLMKLMKRWGVPRVLVTDKLRSYGVAVRDLCPSVDHRSHKSLNNRSEASHRHTRRREKIMGRFKSPRQAQRFLSVHDQTAIIFRPKRHRLSAAPYRQSRADAFSLWNNYAAEMAA